MKTKFFISISLGLAWLAVSLFFAVGWAREISHILPPLYVWCVITGIALLPGFLMSVMFFSNLMHRKPVKYPQTSQDISVIICARNEEENIGRCINSVLNRKYNGNICILVVDNASADSTKEQMKKLSLCPPPGRCVKYIYCAQPGKSNALNAGLAHVCTKYFITLDADTYLEKHAVQKIINHISAADCACVAGNLFVSNTDKSAAAAMQNYDYLLSIASVKRFQGSYSSTLVAQGAFSAFLTEAVRRAGGWQDVMGEDIVLTYKLIKKGLASEYEPAAAAYTTVPLSLGGLYSQRKRWAIGMLEGLRAAAPWEQPKFFSKYFTGVNLCVIYLDLAFLFGFIPGIILALMGYCYIVGILTLLYLAVSLLLYINMYIYRKSLKIPFENSLAGFIAFILFFQIIQSTAAVHGYITGILGRKAEWK